MSSQPDPIRGNNEDDHEGKDCMKCKEIESTYIPRIGSQNLFLFHTDRDIVTSKNVKGKNKRKDDYKPSLRKKHLQKIERIVAALRNTGGGELIIHVKGQRTGDRYLEFFDEWISTRFGDLLENGQRYVDTYVRKWLSDISGLEKFSDFIYINIKKSQSLVTVDYNTKLSNDIEKQPASSSHIRSILSEGTPQCETRPQFTNLTNVDLQSLHECRHRELKGFKSGCMEVENADDVVNYIWSDLKFKDNLTSMSKVRGGGSYFVGIGEEPVDHQSKRPSITGFELNIPERDLLKALREKIRSTVCVLQNRRFGDPPEDLVDHKLHKLPRKGMKNVQKYVLEIIVPYFNGIVFYDKDGPRTYEIDEQGQIQRMHKTTWLHRLTQKEDSVQ